jgi:hypothetical protein
VGSSVSNTTTANSGVGLSGSGEVSLPQAVRKSRAKPAIKMRADADKRWTIVVKTFPPVSERLPTWFTIDWERQLYHYVHPSATKI